MSLLVRVTHAQGGGGQGGSHHEFTNNNFAFHESPNQNLRFSNIELVQNVKNVTFSQSGHHENKLAPPPPQGIELYQKTQSRIAEKDFKLRK